MKAKVKTYEDGVSDGVVFLLYSMAQYLGDKRGWKPRSILRAIKWLHKHAMMVDENYTSYLEVREAVKNEYGIVIEDGQIKFCEEWIGADANGT